MRIAQIVSSYQPRLGGVETHVRHIAEGCARAGDEVTVFTHGVDGAPAEEISAGVRVCRFPLTVNSAAYPFSLSLFRGFRTRAGDFDVAHVHSYHTLAAHAAVGTGVPLVFTPHYHGTGHTKMRAVLHRLYRPAGSRIFQAADAIVCVSEAERDLVVRDFPGTAKKAGIIPNGVGPRTRSPGSGLALPPGPVLLAVGRLERYKNVDLILKAFRTLPCHAVLVVVGEGPERERLAQQAGIDGTGGPVILTGGIPDSQLDWLLATATVVVSASDHEAFGLTMAEGLAAGTRIVASPIPAHAELARLAGDDALVTLADPRDTTAFAGLLAEALAAGRPAADAVKLPSWAEVITDTRDLYSRVRSQRLPA